MPHFARSLYEVYLIWKIERLQKAADEDVVVSRYLALKIGIARAINKQTAHNTAFNRVGDYQAWLPGNLANEAEIKRLQEELMPLVEHAQRVLQKIAGYKLKLVVTRARRGYPGPV